MLHHQILPRPQRHLYDRECHRSAQGAPPGIGTSGGGILQFGLGTACGGAERGVGCNGFDIKGIIIHARILPTALVPLVTGRKDM